MGAIRLTPEEAKLWNDRLGWVSQSKVQKSSNGRLQGCPEPKADQQFFEVQPATSRVQSVDEEKQRYADILDDFPAAESEKDNKSGEPIPELDISVTPLKASAPAHSNSQSQEPSAPLVDEHLGSTTLLDFDVDFVANINVNPARLHKEIPTSFFELLTEHTGDAVSLWLKGGMKSELPGLKWFCQERRFQDSEIDETEFKICGQSRHRATDDCNPNDVECSEDIEVIKSKILSLFRRFIPSSDSNVCSKLRIADMLAVFDSGLSQPLYHQYQAKRSLEEQIIKVEAELTSARSSLGKQFIDAKAQSAENLRSERGAYTKMKEISKTDSDKAQSASTKRYGKLPSSLLKAQAEIGACEKKYHEQLAEENVLQLDYDATLSDLNDLQLEHKKLSDSKNAEVLKLEQEIRFLKSDQIIPEFVKVNIARGVRDATYDMKKEVVKAAADLEKKQYEIHNKQHELDCLRLELKEKTTELHEVWEFVTDEGPNSKEKDKTIKSLKGRLKEQVHLIKTLEKSLREEKLRKINSTKVATRVAKEAQVARLKQELTSEQAKSARLEKKFSDIAVMLDIIESKMLRA
ncbi:uncharacterized protein RAG0_15072 [Rhynchosporium agropyri]|uniref:Uncharacterized protein n=1 Tax=Rhynchosporium agropyri TaxID=914238 RepID=A0A1E1LLF8_9HELO|nr:uncharacterized protein RAG0_15072 [Rhynchosporium agropyri]